MTISTNDTSRRGMRRSMKWGLGATLGLTAAALLWPAPAVVEVRADREPAGSPAPRAASDARIAGPAPAPVTSPPLAEAAAASTGSTFDPFAGVPIAPPAAPAVAPPPSVASAPAAPPPPPPAQEYRFLGRMTGPDGGQQILLGHGEKAVVIVKGTILDNGYVVESISADAVVLAFPSLGARASIPIPQE